MVLGGGAAPRTTEHRANATPQARRFADAIQGFRFDKDCPSRDVVARDRVRRYLADEPERAGAARSLQSTKRLSRASWTLSARFHRTGCRSRSIPVRVFASQRFRDQKGVQLASDNLVEQTYPTKGGSAMAAQGQNTGAGLMTGTATRGVEISTPLGPDVLLFHRMHAREALGRLNDYHATFLAVQHRSGQKSWESPSASQLALPNNGAREFSTASSRASHSRAPAAAQPLLGDGLSLAFVPDAHVRLPRLPEHDRSGNRR